MSQSTRITFSIPNAEHTDPIEVVAVPIEVAATWLERGFADFAACPGIGLAYGAVFAIAGWAIAAGLSGLGLGSLILPAAGGFLILAPLAAFGLYDVSRRRGRGLPVSWASTLRALRGGAQVADLGLILLLLFFAWFVVALVVFALFFGLHPPGLEDFGAEIMTAPQGAAFLAVGTLAGAALAALAFAVSVVALPMLLDRPVSALTAIRTSLAAVWHNRLSMIGWAATLALLGAVGIALLFVGLAVTLPIAAHASWHAYRDLVGHAEERETEATPADTVTGTPA